MPDVNDTRATDTRPSVRVVVENAIRDTARSGLHGYDELARGVLAALDKAGYKVIGKYEIHMPAGVGEVDIDWEGDDA